jgi:hypothetical protein
MRSSSARLNRPIDMTIFVARVNWSLYADWGSLVNAMNGL